MEMDSASLYYLLNNVTSLGSTNYWKNSHMNALYEKLVLPQVSRYMQSLEIS